MKRSHAPLPPCFHTDSNLNVVTGKKEWRIIRDTAIFLISKGRLILGKNIVFKTEGTLTASKRSHNSRSSDLEIVGEA